MAVPSIPPSVNHIYGSGGGGRRFLTDEGKKYKRETTAHLLQYYPQELRYFAKDVPYALVIVLQFAESRALLSEGWPKKAKNRYKKLDADNRIKVFVDALTQATGIDDSQHLSVTVYKTLGERDETQVFAKCIENDTTYIVRIVDALRAGEPQHN